MSETPDDLRYSRNHEWVRANDDGSVTIGITDHAQDQLGDLVYVEVPEPGREVEADEACLLAGLGHLRRRGRSADLVKGVVAQAARLRFLHRQQTTYVV